MKREYVITDSKEFLINMILTCFIFNVGKRLPKDVKEDMRFEDYDWEYFPEDIIVEVIIKMHILF